MASAPFPTDISSAATGLVGRLEGVQPKRWTREEYHLLAEQGWFVDKRVELIDGEIIELSPQSEEHFFGIDNLRSLLEKAFGEAYWVRSQASVAASEHSEPEPDVAVIEGPRRVMDDHPTTALLAVEVSKTTQSYDKGAKADLYASTGTHDYWVLDLVRRELVVHRQPTQNGESRFGWRYAQLTVIPETGEVSPLALPGATLRVAEMLPPSQAGDNS
ncbi:hypothetical protein Mal64_26570 [Pseudobythopirellula maris]|uniref:Putative restriction endonuclease domain-containing protein n=1 Tax=Pseudobythopirellula maris TaxID=2527991 RepID=A0A5C5ZIB8_9BACT|nr:Uma2 family endonuclease [Pseudobythopirellula maris]TWT87122.1 hypothetical protein Mal64_26570 [Pseudobythopirellula maris]